MDTKVYELRWFVFQPKEADPRVRVAVIHRCQGNRTGKIATSVANAARRGQSDLQARPPQLGARSGAEQRGATTVGTGNITMTYTPQT